MAENTSSSVNLKTKARMFCAETITSKNHYLKGEKYETRFAKIGFSYIDQYYSFN
jgi:hypothetical protein